mgnify:CR=1 FL=1
MGFDLVIVKDDDRDLWNEIVFKSNQTHLFHTWKWLKLAERFTGFKLYPILILKGHEPIGIYPIFFKKKIFKLVFSPPPYTGMSYLGPALIGYESLKEDKKLYYLSNLIKIVHKFVFSELKSSYFFSSLSPKLIDVRPYKWLGYEIKVIFHYIMNISDVEKVWKNMKKHARENIKKGIRREYTFELGNQDDIEFIYQALIGRYNIQGKKIYMELEYLKRVYKEFRDNIKIFLCKKDGNYLTGIVAICFKDKISFWIGGAKTDDTYSNDFLHWKAIEWASKNGFKYYEEFGAGTQRLARFKSKFNPELVVCFSVKKCKSYMKLAEEIYRMGRNYLRI